MPELVIDDKPAVMRFVAPLEDLNRFDSRLAVVVVTEAGDAGSYSNGVDLSEDTRGTGAEDVEGLGINVAVYDDGAGVGAFDEGFECDSCCEEFAIEEDHLSWWRGGADEEVELLIVLVESLLNSIEAGIDSLL